MLGHAIAASMRTICQRVIKLPTEFNVALGEAFDTVGAHSPPVDVLVGAQVAMPPAAKARLRSHMSAGLEGAGFDPHIYFGCLKPLACEIMASRLGMSALPILSIAVFSFLPRQ